MREYVDSNQTSSPIRIALKKWTAHRQIFSLPPPPKKGTTHQTTTRRADWFPSSWRRSWGRPVAGATRLPPWGRRARGRGIRSASCGTCGAGSLAARGRPAGRRTAPGRSPRTGGLGTGPHPVPPPQARPPPPRCRLWTLPASDGILNVRVLRKTWCRTWNV